MRKNKKMLSLILVLVMLVSPSLLVAAKEQPTPKDETVYGILATDGKVKEVYVVNGFTLDEPGTILDFGEYAMVSNLTGTEALRAENGQIRADAGSGRFFYEGKLAKAELPWLFQITYRLDGRELTAREAAGKSGLLEIIIKIKKNPQVDPWFFENLTLQVALTLDTENFSEIQAKGATIVTAGKDKQLNFTVFPGKEQTLSLTAKVKAFSLPPLQISGTVMQLQFPEEHLKTLAEPLAKLQAGIAELDGGAQELQKGTAELAVGLKELAGGGQELLSGLTQIQANMGAFTAGTGELAAAAGEINEGASQLSSGLDRLAAENGTLLAGAQQIFAALLASANAQLEPLVQQLKTVNVTVEPLNQDNYAAVLNDLSARLPQLPGGSAYASTLAALKDQLDGYRQFYLGLQQYTNGVARLAAAGDELTAGTAALQNGTVNLNQRAAGLAGAITLMAANAADFSAGLQNASTGSAALHEGAKLLAAGLATFKEQTSALDENLLTGAVESLLGEAPETVCSFVSPKNTNVQTLQFIIRTEEISAPQPPTADATEETTEKRTTFWQKLLKLFIAVFKSYLSD